MVLFPVRKLLTYQRVSRLNFHRVFFFLPPPPGRLALALRSGGRFAAGGGGHRRDLLAHAQRRRADLRRGGDPWQVPLGGEVIFVFFLLGE